MQSFQKQQRQPPINTAPNSNLFFSTLLVQAVSNEFQIKNVLEEQKQVGIHRILKQPSFS